VCVVEEDSGVGLECVFSSSDESFPEGEQVDWFRHFQKSVCGCPAANMHTTHSTRSL